MSIIAKVVVIDGEEQVVIENVVSEPIEFRLYYDENGMALFYTCEKPEGNYVVVDKQTYAEMRLDIKIVDGKITKLVPGIMISKLKPNPTNGVNCAIEDISIIVDDQFTDKQKWKLTSYELR